MEHAATTASRDTIAELLARDLGPIGAITLEQRFDGIAVLDDGVMFGFVDADGTSYLRATADTAREFYAKGATKHPAMPYWSIPPAVAADLATLRDVAYRAADSAHLAFSFGVDEYAPRAAPPKRFSTLVAIAALAA